MLEVASDVRVVGIDEAQFYDASLVEVARLLRIRGVRVIIAGLDTDYLGKPFGSMRPSWPLPRMSRKSMPSV